MFSSLPEPLEGAVSLILGVAFYKQPILLVPSYKWKGEATAAVQNVISTVCLKKVVIFLPLNQVQDRTKYLTFQCTCSSALIYRVRNTNAETYRDTVWAK